MKKLFFFAATLLVAGSMMADITIDLNTAEQATWAEETDNFSSTVSNNVLTGTISTDGKDGLNGAAFEFPSPLAGSSITAINGKFKCTASEKYISIIPYLMDEDGHVWFNGDLGYTAASCTDWTEYNYKPTGAPWDEVSKTFNESTFTHCGLWLTTGNNPLVNYVFYLKEIKVFGSCTTALQDVKATAPVTKKMIDGKMMIMRDGNAYNVLGF